MTAIIIAIVVFGFVVFCIVGCGNLDKEGFDDDEEISAVDEWLKRKNKEKNL